MNFRSRLISSVVAGLIFLNGAFAITDASGKSYISYNPSGYVAQGVLNANGSFYPNDSYQLLITGPSAASSTNPITVSLVFTVLNSPSLPAGYSALQFISANGVLGSAATPASITFNGQQWTDPKDGKKYTNVIPVTISVQIPSSVGGASSAGSYGWRVQGADPLQGNQPGIWPAAANVWPQHVLQADGVTYLDGDPGATVNGTANDPIVSPGPPVIKQATLAPGDGATFLYTGTAITFPISFEAIATGTTSSALITGLSATFDGFLFNGTPYKGVPLPTLSTTGIQTLAASGYVMSPPISDSGPHTIVVSAANGVDTTTATMRINILEPAKITNTNSPTFTYGQAGSFTVTAKGYPAPTFAADSLPAWATLNSTTGVISGTPTSTGPFSFTVTASNNVPGGIDTRTFTFTVVPAIVNVAADAKGKTYGASDPSLTFTATGLANGDTAASVFAGSLVRAAGESVGTYAISQGTLTANSNYVVTYTSAGLTISPKALTVTASPTTKVYGTLDPQLAFTSSGLANGDTPSVFSGLLARVAGETAGAYAILKGSLSAGPNYAITFVSANLTISPRVLTAATTASNKVYNASAQASFTATPVGVLGTDAVTIIGGAATFDTKNVGNNKTVTVTGLSLAGTAAVNYVLNPTSATTTASITPATLTVTADSKSMVSGTSLPVLTASYSGFVGGETLATSGVSGAPALTTTATGTSAAGTYPITATVGTLAAGNYVFTFLPGVLTVTGATTSPTCGTAIVRHAPKIDGNAGVDGSLQVLLPENMALNGNAFISEKLLVVGSPSLRLNGKTDEHPRVGSETEGECSPSPSSYTITLNGNAVIGTLVRRTDAVAMPVVPLPASGSGTRDVKINKSTESAGSFATVRDLTVNGNVDPVTVPAGNYRDFTVTGNCSLVLGVAGATAPSIYNLRSIKFTGNSTLRIVGPVVLNVADDASFEDNAGDSSHPDWLVLNLHSGGLTLNGTPTFHGYVLAPNGEVRIDGLGKLCGKLTCDRLTLNGWGLVDLCNCKETVRSRGDNDSGHDDEDGEDDEESDGGHS